MKEVGEALRGSLALRAVGDSWGYQASHLRGDDEVRALSHELVAANAHMLGAYLGLVALYRANRIPPDADDELAGHLAVSLAVAHATGGAEAVLAVANAAATAATLASQIGGDDSDEAEDDTRSEQGL